MPVSMHKLKSGKVEVSTPNGVKSYGSTPENAEKQARLLRAVDHGFVPSHGKNALAKRLGACVLACFMFLAAPAFAQFVTPNHPATDSAQAIVCAHPLQSFAVTSCTVQAQSGTLNNAQSTSAANTAQTITLTGVAGKRWTLRQLYGACSAGSTAAITIADGGTTILSVPGLSTTIAALIPSPPATGITISSGNNLVVTVPSCGASNTSTVSIIADES